MKAFQVKTRMVAFKLTPDQYSAIEKRAEERGMRMGPWMRLIVLQVAAAPKNGHFVKIREPNGATT